jgi:hypothetical protein
MQTINDALCDEQIAYQFVACDYEKLQCQSFQYSSQMLDTLVFYITSIGNTDSSSVRHRRVRWSDADCQRRHFFSIIRPNKTTTPP